jgi:hypothetical protein
MDTVESFVKGFVSKVLPRDDIAGRLKKFYEASNRDIKKIGNYFFITDLTTPSDTLTDVKFKKEKSQKLKEILNRGDKIHSIAQNWLRQHKDYNGSESILDGSIMGILARGKIDGRLNESIIEIKSIKKLPESAEEIIQNYPQYIEQVAFYCAIDPLRPRENYLLFVTRYSPYFIKIFKLTILDFEKIKNVLKKRIYLLKEVLENKKEHQEFGRCRYCYQEDCNIKKDGKCNLCELPPLKCEVKEFIQLEENSSLFEEINNIRQHSKVEYNQYSSYNLICPRKYCLKKIKDVEESYDTTISFTKDYFSKIIYNFCNIHYSEEELKPSTLESFKLNSFSWFNDITALNPEGKIIPFVMGVTQGFNMDYPSDYKIAELGLYLMAHGLTKGLIFSYYTQKETFKVFEITFDFKGDYLSELKKIIKGLDTPKNYLSLPKCPSYFCQSKNNSCPYLEYCEEPHQRLPEVMT